MTQKLYFEDPLTFEFTATVIEATINDDGTSNIILDKTYFYPTGGGQSHDKGTLGTKEILAVHNQDGVVIHLVQGEPATGDIRGKIDKTYRRGNMSAHTGQHILSATFLHELEAETLAVKMNATGLSTVDIARADLTQAQIDGVELLANSIITENRAVKSYFVSPDSPKLEKLRRAVKFDKVTGDVRLVEIDNFDLSACAGTHFPQTGMLGLLKILKVENYKGGSRIHFAVGQEALIQFQTYQQAIDKVSNLLSSGIDQVPELVEKLQAERSELAKKVTTQSQKLLAYEAQEILEKASKTDKVIKLVLENYAADDLRVMANHLTENASAIVAMVNQVGEDMLLIIATGSDNDIHAGNALGAILAEFDGKGGGREHYAQGILKGFDDTAALVRAIDKHLT